MMQLSEKGKRHLIVDEGSKTKAYQDTKKIWTIGVGFTKIYGRAVTASDVLTVEQIAELLPVILKEYEDAVNAAITEPMFQHEFDAFVCLAYNIGANGFKLSSVAKSFNKGNKALAVADMFQWRKPYEVLGRRYNDAKLFACGEYLG